MGSSGINARVHGVPTRAKLTVFTETKKVEIEIGDDFSVECRATLVPVGLMKVCSIAGPLDKLGIKINGASPDGRRTVYKSKSNGCFMKVINSTLQDRGHYNCSITTEIKDVL